MFTKGKHSKNLARKTCQQCFHFKRGKSFLFGCLSLSWKFALSRVQAKEFALWSRKLYFPNLSHCCVLAIFISHWNNGNNYPALLLLLLLLFCKNSKVYLSLIPRKKTLNYISEYLEHIVFFQFFSIKNNKEKTWDTVSVRERWSFGVW